MRYNELQEELKFGVFKARDEYPTTMSKAYELLLHTSRQLSISHRQVTRTNNRFRKCNPQNNFIFAQNERLETRQPTGESNGNNQQVAGQDRVTHDEITCFTCQSIGHYSSQRLCISGTNLARVGLIFT